MEGNFFQYRDGVHFDLSIEKAILGACLLEKTAFARICNLVDMDILFNEFHKIVFSALTEMYQQGYSIDLLTVTHHLRKNKITEYNGYTIPYLLTGLMIDVVSTAHLEAHSLILRELYLERELTKISHSKFDGDAIEKAASIDAAIKKAFSIKGTDDWHDLSEVLKALDAHRAEVKNREMGVPSGFPSLDRLTAGFQPGQLIVIGARPSVGKSAFVGGIAINAASKGKVVGIISLEMPEEQLGGRIASIYSDIEFYKIYRNLTDADEEKRLMESLKSLQNLPIYISDKTNVTSMAIRSKSEKLQQRKGIELLIIDYLQLVETEASNGVREREIAKLSRSLKLMALDLKIPVIILCQLNRDSEKDGKSKKPRMSQIRESGSIEQDADVVMLLHREWKSGVLTKEDGSTTEFDAEIILEKNRNGETRNIPISFKPDMMKFYEEEEFHTPKKSVETPYTDGIRNYPKPEEPPF